MPLRLLCVTAHPDDECFAFGGALALAVERGVEVSVLCLTDGQAATNRGTAASGAELGAMRRKEFVESCKLLGIKEYEVLHYQDAQLEFANFSEVAGLLVERLRTWRPDVVLTFGGDGALNTHPDHSLVSFFTTAAFHWAGRPKRYPEQLERGLQTFCPRRLYFQTTSFLLPDRPPLLPAPYTVTLDIRSVLKKKLAAFALHTSQSPLVEKTRPVFEKFGQSEHYVLAAASKPQAAAQTTDLFDGLM
ncbi:MAG TPA: PIG-L family deacetylase [Acidobacteriaceae bacterium]|jgi:LmbE family N-acetylglucosaminyl deacetylase|nr:PIG-L family deacetylase [Acidobacteriaceae bacterium]